MIKLLVFGINNNDMIERIFRRASTILTKIKLSRNGINIGKFISLGVPYIKTARTGLISFGTDIVFVNTYKNSMLGKTNRCKFQVGEKAVLKIGDNVGMSNCTIISTTSISIGNNILMGGGVYILDTDFHSLNYTDWHTDLDAENAKSKPIVIGDNVFIGMDSVILKGVEIGSNSIIGARSVVTQNVPQGEVWAGNPAKFIRKNKWM